MAPADTRSTGEESMTRGQWIFAATLAATAVLVATQWEDIERYRRISMM